MSSGRPRRLSGVMAANFAAPEAVEGIDAFVEKRKPSWEEE